jgi:hypothetical protein
LTRRSWPLEARINGLAYILGVSSTASLARAQSSNREPKYAGCLQATLLLIKHRRNGRHNAVTYYRRTHLRQRMYFRPSALVTSRWVLRRTLLQFPRETEAGPAHARLLPWLRRLRSGDLGNPGRDTHAITAMDVLKIDVQDAELSVFRVGSERLAHAVVLQTEVSFTQQIEQGRF